MSVERHLVVATCHDEAAMQLLATMPQGDIRQRHGFHHNLELSIEPESGLLRVLRRVPMDVRVQKGTGHGETVDALPDWGQQIEGKRITFALNPARVPYWSDKPQIRADVFLHGFFRLQHEELADNPASVREVLQQRFDIPPNHETALLIVVDPEPESDFDPAGGAEARSMPPLPVVDLVNRLAHNSRGIVAVALAVTGLERSFAKIGTLDGDGDASAVEEIACSEGWVRKLLEGLMQTHGHLFGMVQALATAGVPSTILPVSSLGFIRHWEPNFDLLFRRPKWTPAGVIGTAPRELGENNFFPRSGQLLDWSPYLTADPFVWLMAKGLRNPFAFEPRAFYAADRMLHR